MLACYQSFGAYLCYSPLIVEVINLLKMKVVECFSDPLRWWCLYDILDRFYAYKYVFYLYGTVCDLTCEFTNTHSHAGSVCELSLQI